LCRLDYLLLDGLKRRSISARDLSLDFSHSDFNNESGKCNESSIPVNNPPGGKKKTYRDVNLVVGMNQHESIFSRSGFVLEKDLDAAMSRGKDFPGFARLFVSGAARVSHFFVSF
jgi:hypothetical protein